jgi:hypothetical protein
VNVIADQFSHFLPVWEGMPYIIGDVIIATQEESSEGDRVRGGGMKRHPMYARYNMPPRPKDTILASNKPMQIGEVIIIPPHRFVVAEEVTEEEFRRRASEHLKFPHVVLGNVLLAQFGCRHTAVFQEEPEPKT